MHVLASAHKGGKSKCRLFDMKGKLTSGGSASEGECASQHHTLPVVDCFSYPELHSHYKVCTIATFL